MTLRVTAVLRNGSTQNLTPYVETLEDRSSLTAIRSRSPEGSPYISGWTQIRELTLRTPVGLPWPGEDIRLLTVHRTGYPEMTGAVLCTAVWGEYRFTLTYHKQIIRPEEAPDEIRV